MDGCPSEDDLVGLSRGALAPAAHAALLTHLDGCDVCRRAAARLTSDEAGPAAPLTIGRYHLREPLGAGAMGIVFAAHDPALDRKVAVKLLRREHGLEPDATVAPRLVREARALARLAHPNVIAAYEVGRHDGEVFLAMELVDGGTLTSWLAAQPRTRRAIVDAFVQAGEGLAAAHAAGIVHRDFKPDNVLIGGDGRVRVTDFGLASGGLAVGSPVPRDAGGVALTRTGALAGTPAYMAPELLDGAPASARSDQFAWAVALWAALFGVRPFAGDSVAALVVAARAGKPQVVPGRDVPRGLQAALTRALAAEPDGRWPDMRAALAAVSPFAAPAPTRRRLAIATALVTVAGAAVAITMTVRGGAAPRCGVDAPGLWDGPQRDAVTRAFAAAAPGSAPIAGTVDAAMTRFRDRWAAARADACRLGAAGAARASCLDIQRVHADTLVRLFATADAATVERAVEAVADLPDPTACSRPPAPVPAGKAALARALETQLAETQAIVGARRPVEAVPIFDEIAATAQAAGLARIAALAALGKGEALGPTDLEAQIRSGREVLAIATQLGDQALALDALVAMLFPYGQRGEHALAAFVDELAVEVAAAAGDPPAPVAMLAVARCQRAWQQGTPEPRALEVCADARRRTVVARGEDDYRVAEVDTEAGNVAFMLGRYDEAIALYRRSADHFERLYGRDTNRVAAPLGNTAEALVRQNRATEAIPIFERLLATAPNCALWDGLAQARRSLGDHAGAAAAFTRAAETSDAIKLPSLGCAARVGVVEELLAMDRGTELPAALAQADATCAPVETAIERARLAFAHARVRDRAGDRRGADAALADAEARVVGAAPDSPGARLAADLAAWRAAHRR
ncbi:MAG: serine/threonine protein kinase [Myxococcales bacterium]|nr:serine/threonine protein kinase [Myxococcales bacterium]